MGGTIELAFEDSILYRSDIDIIQRNKWLNDHCILFWFQYLEHEKFKSRKNEFVLVQPAAAFMLQFLTIDKLLSETTDNIYRRIAEVEIAFLPIVGNADADKGGGSHWSLLVFEKDTIYHVDSSNGYNEQFAQITAKKLEYLAQKVKGLANVKYKCVNLSPQQHNSYDCGIYVVANAEEILRYFLQYRKLKFPTEKSHVQMKRKEMLETITRLKKKSS